MQALFDDPMVQSGLAPFAVALIVALALQRTRLAWLAIGLAFAASVALSTGLNFESLSAARKVVVLVLLAPLVGLALDRFDARSRWLLPTVATVCGLASLWVYQSVLTQRETLPMLTLAASMTVFVALVVGATVRLREDGPAAGAAALALGLSVGVAAFLSASVGNLMNGVVLAASAGALLLLQFISGRALVPGFVGTLTVGLAAALFAATTFVLAKLPWYALPLLPLVPLAAGLVGRSDRPVRLRLVTLTLIALAVSSATILAAWLATRTAAN